MPSLDTIEPANVAIDRQYNRHLLRDAGVLAVSIMGNAGCGKTTLLTRTLQLLGPALRVGVAVANPAAKQDEHRFRKLAAHVEAVESAEFDATALRSLLERAPLHTLDVFFIESAGRPEGSAGSELGQHARVAVLSVSGGDEQVRKFPERFTAADIMLITKFDLLPHVGFDLHAFAELRQLNSKAPLLEISPLHDKGMQDWVGWLESQLEQFRSRLARPDPDEMKSQVKQFRSRLQRQEADEFDHDLYFG
jgi:hydrogenase nickel incorporation protein HypB